MVALRSISFFLGFINLALGSPICHAEDNPDPTRIKIQKTLTQNVVHDPIFTPAHTPHPHMVNNCNRFYWVEPRETCWGISNRINETSTYKISVDQIKKWNGLTDPSQLWAKVFACVGVTGQPRPNVHDRIELRSESDRRALDELMFARNYLGATWNCYEWYFGKPGNTCDYIEETFHVDDDDLKAWNPQLKCNKSLRFDTWVCVRAKKNPLLVREMKDAALVDRL